jgi:hypothetical protein
MFTKLSPEKARHRLIEILLRPLLVEQGRVGETTKNIYGHLFAQDRAFILKAINQAVSRLYVHEDTSEEAA